MLNRITLKIAVGAMLLALVTPAFATPMGTDPEPKSIVHTVLVFLGLA